MITLENVSKSYNDINIFEHIQLEFPENKKCFIEGINGSGKSVLLKLICGFSIPDEGKFIRNG